MMTSNKVLRDELLNCRTMFAALAMQVGEWRHAANEAILRIDGALSQPPRNCDRPLPRQPRREVNTPNQPTP